MRSESRGGYSSAINMPAVNPTELYFLFYEDEQEDKV